ncbi:hypothetical protein [Photobacterium kishitanii]|uniref:hypothetical protein n=1 Tax=Photobacterium kishitanii TaxID=318456 RepID=UPI0015E7DF55|nr:hypothetical protein [Photobacterium kishitanii]
MSDGKALIEIKISIKKDVFKSAWKALRKTVSRNIYNFSLLLDGLSGVLEGLSNSRS